MRSGQYQRVRIRDRRGGRGCAPAGIVRCALDQRGARRSWRRTRTVRRNAAGAHPRPKAIMLFRIFTLIAVIALAVSTWILSSPNRRPAPALSLIHISEPTRLGM